MADEAVRRVLTTDPTLLAAAAALRTAVFTAEQGVDPAVERDGWDDQAVHAVVCDGDGAVVGTGRLLDASPPDAAPADTVARIGRVAVAAGRRGHRVGAQVMADLHRAAADRGLVTCRLHAQAPVTGFYQRLGYHPAGPPDVEAGLPHQWMTRAVLPGLRAAQDTDARGVQDLIGGCFAEYPGCVLDLADLDRWMRAPASAGRSLQVLPAPGPSAAPGRSAAPGPLLASVGWAAVGPHGRAELVDALTAAGLPTAGAWWELKSLYVTAAARRLGYGRALVGVASRAARLGGAHTQVLWSDSRFRTAHRLYGALGFDQLPVTRALHDPSDTTEFAFARRLR